jgi:hypothetical protein
MVLAIVLALVYGVSKWPKMLEKGRATWVYIAIGAVWLGFYLWRAYQRRT